jgi:hypothetical protein
METFVASLSCTVSVAWCAERLVRGRDVRWALVPLAIALAAWVWLWSVRLPPTPGRALLAFSLADLGVLALGVLGVMRLLGGFDRYEPPAADEGWGDDGDDDPSPVVPQHPAPHLPHPSARHHVPPRNRRRQDHRRRRTTEV